MFYIRCIGCKFTDSDHGLGEHFSDREGFEKGVKEFIERHLDCDTPHFEVGIKAATMISAKSDTSGVADILMEITEKYIRRVI